ncbi:hypothetical protein ABTY96_03065 [Streptomyces sp. NPDC096057]|uniref:hypothetical protein n=1 Tax=Streptomyces sp. NPDC096057 TaxID=3155543 RepID=UPI003327C787
MTNDPVCGATKTFPEDPVELEKRCLSPDLAGVTITCEDAPHACVEEDVVHMGILLDGNGALSGVFYWGPGWRPTSLL